MHVLFVDDDEVLAQGVEMALREHGHVCEVTDLGKEALTLAKRNAYDIVVLDVSLPDIDGCHVVRRMKMEGVDTPVVLQSGLIDPELSAEAQDLGAEDFLPKPFSIAELIERMEAVLARKGIGTPDPAPEPPAPESPAQPNRDAGPGSTRLPDARPKAAPSAAPAPRPAPRPAPPPRPEAEPSPKSPAEPPAEPPFESAEQASPPPRPAAVAAARAALLAEPETPTGLHAVSEAMAERGAKALAKAVTTARTAIGPKIGCAAEPQPDPDPKGPPGTDPESETGRGAGTLAKAMAKARGALSAEPFSKAVAMGRAALDAKPLSQLAADAKAALGAEPLSKAAAKARAALVARAKAVTGPQDTVEPGPRPDVGPVAPESPDSAPAPEATGQIEDVTQDPGPAAAEPHDEVGNEAQNGADTPGEPEPLSKAEAVVEIEAADPPVADCQPEPGSEDETDRSDPGPSRASDLPRDEAPPGDDPQTPDEPDSLSEFEAAPGDPPAGPSRPDSEPETDAEAEDKSGTDWPVSDPPQMPDALPAEAEADTPGGPGLSSEHGPAAAIAPADPPAPDFEPDPEAADRTGTDWPESEPPRIPKEASIEAEPGNEGDASAGSAPLPEFEPVSDHATSEPEPEPSPEPEDEPEGEAGTDWLESGPSPPLHESRPEPEAWAEPAPGESSLPDAAPDQAPEPNDWSVDDVLSDLVPELEPEPADGPAAGSNKGPEAAIGRAGEGDAEFEADPGRDGAERRRHERVSVIEPAVIEDGENSLPCIILDRSEGGAAVRLCKPDRDCPESFSLRPLDGPARRCTRRWREGDKIGVEFI